jgi:EmrB/QacA subfamily drug resistance transporter
VTRNRQIWTFAITAVALFIVALDNLVVTTALPVIRTELDATLSELTWMVNAYTLTFAVLLLPGAALGDRFGRKRMFIVGLAIFTIGSAAAAVADSSELLILARAIQGVGGAIVTPLTLTILSSAVSPERRAVALGAWGGIGGLAIAIGPLVGGAIAEGLSWNAIFWVNVPIGIVAMILAATRLEESYGPEGRLDLPGIVLASAGLLALVWGVINGNDEGWTDPTIVAALVTGAVLLAGFLVRQARTSEPMLPLRFFRSRAFSVANGVSFLMYFGVFGAIFLLSQFFQVVQGMGPFEAGLRTLPWTGAPAIVAPIAGLMAGRIGGRPILVAGMILLSAGLAWLAAVVSPTVEYGLLVPGFLLAGVGMGLFFAPIADIVLSSVPVAEEGKASGATNTIREVGGVFGVAVLASVFSANGSYATPTEYVNGLQPAIWLGAAVVGAAAVIAIALPGRIRRPAAEAPLDGAGGGTDLTALPAGQPAGEVRPAAI